MIDAFILALGLVFDPKVLGVIVASAVFGVFVGAIPGLTATMATALLVPITFFMDQVSALGAIVTVTAMAIFAGDIPAALLRIPGTPASAAYTDESFALAKNGRLDLNLGVNLVFSVLGGLVGVVILVIASPVLAEFAINFSSYEYFWLASFGLTCAVFISTGSPVKGFASLLLGIAVSTIGIDPAAGYPRFTFGNIELLQGISFIPAMIGMFAIAEILRNVTAHDPSGSTVPQQIGNVFRGVGGVMRRYWRNFLRGSGIGIFIGVLPGAGADIAAWVSYAASKRFSREPEKFGTGHIEGIVESTSANNSALGGAWIPALVFGIPGDTITAIAIGVLYMKGMNPGPTVFIQNPQFIYAVFIIFFLANLLLLPLGWAVIKSAKQILRVPRNLLIPIVLIFCVIGSYAMTNSIYGVGVMVILGVVGWLMEENGFPVAPFVLGLVLGELLEQNLMTSLIKAEGNPLAFFTRPIAGVFGVLTLFIWSAMIFQGIRNSLRQAQTGSIP